MHSFMSQEQPPTPYSRAQSPVLPPLPTRRVSSTLQVSRPLLLRRGRGREEGRQEGKESRGGRGGGTYYYQYLVYAALYSYSWQMFSCLSPEIFNFCHWPFLLKTILLIFSACCSCSIMCGCYGCWILHERQLLYQFSCCCCVFINPLEPCGKFGCRFKQCYSYGSTILK